MVTLEDGTKIWTWWDETYTHRDGKKTRFTKVYGDKGWVLGAYMCYAVAFRPPIHGDLVADTVIRERFPIYTAVDDEKYNHPRLIISARLYGDKELCKVLKIKPWPEEDVEEYERSRAERNARLGISEDRLGNPEKRTIPT